MIEGIKLLIGILLLAIGLPVAIIAWVKCFINLFKIWGHVNQEALDKYAFLRINRLNAIFIPGALDEEGIKARTILVKNTFIFSGCSAVVMGYAAWTGLLAT
ncbi:MAG: hypothetical protein JXA04_10255 [Gammaproteobacteria bacterium]|nr:hypothetical protein [Gammaproteobacteria bacterium]